MILISEGGQVGAMAGSVTMVHWRVCAPHEGDRLTLHLLIIAM